MESFKLQKKSAIQIQCNCKNLMIQRELHLMLNELRKLVEDTKTMHQEIQKLLDELNVINQKLKELKRYREFLKSSKNEKEGGCEK